MRRINYWSDFTLNITLKDANGVASRPPSDHDWSITVTDGCGHCWTGSFKGGTYTGLSVDSDGVITCYVDNPGYTPSNYLTIVYRDDIPDAHFADGYDNQVTVLCEDLWVWAGATDTMDAIDASLVIPMITPRITGAGIIPTGDLLITIDYEIENPIPPR